MRQTVVSLVIGFFVSTPVVAQPPVGDDDAITQQASQLEGELGKFKATAPEAAEVMVKLAELYHQHGRVLGLIRATQTFTAVHPADPRHQQMMLKLMDGLEIMSRTKDLVVACRQFLDRYPTAPAAAEIEIRLARTLLESSDREGTAAAHRVVWKRHGANPVGRAHAVQALRIYLDQLGGEFVVRGAELAEEMYDALPKGEFAREVGWRAFESWRRTREYAKSNVVGNKMLQRNLFLDPAEKRKLFVAIGENHGSQGQHRNAYNAYGQARSLSDSADVAYRQLQALHSAQAPAQDIERLANEYPSKFPGQANRYHGKSFLAHAYLRAQNTPRALALFRELLSLDPAYSGNATNFVSYNGAEPPQLADTEKHLLAAIQKLPGQSTYLRYVLAFNVYRDRLKDEAKTRQTLRDLVTRSPDDSGNTRGAIGWLLSSAPDDAQFAQLADLILQSRRAHLSNNTLRNYPRDWAVANQKNKDLKPRADVLVRKLAAVDNDPVMKPYLAQLGSDRAIAATARGELLAKFLGQLPQPIARQLTEAQAHYFRHYAPAKQRADSATIWVAYCKRFPKDYSAAANFVYNATDYSPPEVRQEAAQRLLAIPATQYSADLCRRLFIAADSNKNADLARAAYAWMIAARQTVERPDPTYSAYYGDILLKYKAEAEANAVWTAGLTLDANHYESRECASRLLVRKEGPDRVAFIGQMLKLDTDFHGRYTTWLANEQMVAGDLAGFEQTLARSRERQNERPFRSWEFDWSAASTWINKVRQDEKVTVADRRRVYVAIGKLELPPISAVARLILLETDDQQRPPIARLLTYQTATREVGNDYWGWDPLAQFARSTLAKKDYLAAATLATGLLANVTGNVNQTRKEQMRQVVSQSYARMGTVGLTIDENSPIAPLLQAALYLRLGDRKLAFDTFAGNKPLFDEHRNELPVDLIAFVCESLIAAGGDENSGYVEEVLRGWMVKHSESKEIDDTDKAEIQLLLGRNYFRARRYDIARSEFMTVINRYAESPQAVEAEFGVGETFMEQRVFDQAAQVFEKLAQSRNTPTVVRAEFLRGVLSFRRGDRDEARQIFQAVLERVPDVQLANQTLYNLAEVYRVEERYIDQLTLLRTVGRLGRRSKRRHNPGAPLSIVVHDSDLGISRGHNKIPVLITTVPGGDREMIYLVGTGAGKGLFRFELSTALGEPEPGDKVLQLRGDDTIKCDYPDAFKAEFKNVPLSDVEIQMAASAEFEVASSQIEDEQEATFSQQLEREANTQDRDQRVSQIRPATQIKPGNPIYLRIKDADRDLSGKPDTVVVRVSTDSSDEVQVRATETGEHTGIFEASLETAELPAGALATDTAIDHSPLMAIDKDPKTFWQSQPDGVTPKQLTVDMKDLYPVSRARIATPNAERHAPVRGVLQGSYDGEFWFRLAAFPPAVEAQDVTRAFGTMTQRVYPGNFTGYTNWLQVVNLVRNTKPADTAAAGQLAWSKEADDEEAEKPFAVVWFGKFVQPQDGALRILVRGGTTAMVVDKMVELPLGKGERSVDLWLPKGLHDLTIFAATTQAKQPLEATRARARLDSATVTLAAFHASDFDLTQPAAEELIAPAAQAAAALDLDVSAAKLNKKTEQFAVAEVDGFSQIQQWASVEDIASWDFECTTPGVYEVWVDYAHPGNGGRYHVELGGQVLDVAVGDTGGWNKFKQLSVGSILIESPGRFSLGVRPQEIAGGSLLNLRGISLQPSSKPEVIALGTEWEFRFPRKELRYARFVVHEYLGESVAINHVEIGEVRTGDTYIPTEADLLALASNDVLEIAAGDTVTATYTDERTQSISGGSRLLTRELTATYNNATVSPIAYDYNVSASGVTTTARKELLRVDPGEEIVVEIVDYDRDVSAEPDKINLEVYVNDGEPIPLTATETDAFTGVFTRKIFTSADKQEVGGKEEALTLAVKQGDSVMIRYYDQENTFPGHAVPRLSTVLVNQPTAGRVRILESRVVLPPPGTEGSPRVVYQDPPEKESVSRVAFAAPLTVEVIDPDAAKDSRSSVDVTVTTSDGAKVNVTCVISGAFWQAASTDFSNPALREGRFVGQVILQLGGKDSVAVVPLTQDMPRGLIGRVQIAEEGEEEPQDATRGLVARVLSLTGSDEIAARYDDQRRPADKPEQLVAAGRLVTSATLQVTDREYEKEIENLHVGEKLYAMVRDFDRDATHERDEIELIITTEKGERETVTLAETTSHSGVFAGSFPLQAADAPTADNADPKLPIIESYFGDSITVKYVDPAAPVEADRERLTQLPVVVGTDALVSAFSKTFSDEDLAVETKFRIAESYFELFKSHKELGRDDEQQADLESGRRRLREVMEDYPDPKYAPRVAYLLGQFAQELEQWEEAIGSYEMILRQYPDHTLAPDAQYKLAQCHEEAGEFDDALEAYVTLAATHPKSPLIASVMIRISDYFYKQENYLVAAQVGRKFLERFEGHQHAAKMAFRIGQSFYKQKDYALAGQSFDRFSKLFPEGALGADALFWSGESYRLGQNNREAFRRYNRCRWDFPSSEAAKYARGRLALPEMLQQFEAEANSIDQDN